MQAIYTNSKTSERSGFHGLTSMARFLHHLAKCDALFHATNLQIVPPLHCLILLQVLNPPGGIHTAPKKIELSSSGGALPSRTPLKVGRIRGLQK